MTTFSQDVSFGRVLSVLAATVIILAGLSLAAPILNPILIALVLALIFAPVHAWLLRRKLPSWLAIIIMLLGVTALFGMLFWLVATSITRLSSQLAFYVGALDDQMARLTLWLSKAGLTEIDPTTLLSGSGLNAIFGAVISGVSSILSSAFFILFTLLFFLGEGPSIMQRLRDSLLSDSQRIAQLAAFGRSVTVGFGLRALVNLVTGAGFGLLLFILGVDFALLWGILTFFLSFVPYIGIVLAAIPPILLALAEFGFTRALLVLLASGVANVLAENLLAPALMGRGLNLSPTVVFISFAFWLWLLGAAGAFLAMPLTVFVVLMLETFPETRWLANVMLARAASAPATPEAEAVNPT